MRLVCFGLIAYVKGSRIAFKRCNNESQTFTKVRATCVNTLGQSDASIDLTSKFMTYRTNQHLQAYIHNLVKTKRQVKALFCVVQLLFGFVCTVFAFICMFHYSCRMNIKIGSHCLKMSKFLFCLHCQNSFLFLYTPIFLKSCKWHLEFCLFISWKKKSRKYLVYNMLQKLKTLYRETCDGYFASSVSARSVPCLVGF